MEIRRKIKVLSRLSAVSQVKEAMLLFRLLDFELVVIDGLGDDNKVEQLSDATPTDFFTQELGGALLSGKGDVVVHPATELPYPLPNGLKLLALLDAPNKAESLANDSGFNVSEFHKGHLAVVGNLETGEFDALFREADLSQRYGKVFIVGNGPGSKDYLTLKGYGLLGGADVILHDDLIEDAFLDEFNGEKIYVGKRSGYHSKEQHEIDALLLKLATDGKKVVRLKGGDPSLYGHLAEEIYTLESNFVKVEVIPGITSALAAAAFAQAPLTVRNVSKSVTFCMAHIPSDIPTPNSETIVYFMSAANAKAIAKKLIASGRKPETPVCMVYNVGNKDEMVFRETLLSLLSSAVKYPTPLIIIVGENGNKANFHKALTKKPRVLFTGTQPEKYSYLGNIVHHPLIQVGAIESTAELRQTLLGVNGYDWLIFTSKYAVRYFFGHLFDGGNDARHLQNTKICSIGRVTSAELKLFGIIPDFEPDMDSSVGIIELFKKNEVTGKKILIPRSDKALPVLPNGLSELGNNVDALVIYKNTVPEDVKPVDLSKFDLVVFCSPSGVKNFFDLYKGVPKGLEVVTRGSETQKALDKVWEKV